MTPSIGLTGVYTIAPPFCNDTFFSHSLQAMRIESFGALIEDGEEPYSAYYEPYNLEHADYRRDVAGKIAIVTLRNTAGETRKIPSSYIVTLPLVGGIEYVPVSMVIQLPNMYANLSYDAVLESLKDIIHKTLGVDPVGIKVVASGAPVYVNDVDHRLLEGERRAVTQDPNNNLLAELSMLRARDREMTAKLKVLEQVLVAMKLDGYYSPASTGLMMHITTSLS